MGLSPEGSRKLTTILFENGPGFKLCGLGFVQTMNIPSNSPVSLHILESPGRSWLPADAHLVRQLVDFWPPVRPLLILLGFPVVGPTGWTGPVSDLLHNLLIVCTMYGILQIKIREKHGVDP